MPTTPPPEHDFGEKVDNLAASVDGLRDAVTEERVAREENTAAQHEATQVLREKLSRSDRALRGTRRLGVAFAVLAVGGFLAVLLVVRDTRRLEDRRERDAIQTLVTNCELSNSARAARALRDEQLGGLLLDAAFGLNPAPTPEDAARRAGYVAQIKASYAQLARQTLPPELQQRDCSVRAVTGQPG